MSQMDPQSPVAPLDPIVGQTIGNYRVTAKVGEGGMGSVYLAEHPQIGKRVALKVLHAEFAYNQDVVTRFFNEAKAVNDIGHPNIVDIIDFGVFPGTNPGEKFVYFMMEYLTGQTLTELVRSESALPPERAFAIALQCADALSASHRCGIVHRDLKPDNVMLPQRNQRRGETATTGIGMQKDAVKLLDFGIAKLTGDKPGSSRTRTGIVMGTPAYMSPEQCEGSGTVDHRTDIYALGIVLYEMLTGRVPFLGQGYGAVLVQHLTQKPIPPSQIRPVPPHVDAVVLKALEKSPDMRFPNMDEFMRALTDPVGYVEHHGGLANFLQRRITSDALPAPQGSWQPAVSAVMPTMMAPSSPSLAAYQTQPPAAVSAYQTQPPASLTAYPHPTVPPTATRSKKLPIIVGVTLALAGAVIAAVTLGGKPAPKKADVAVGSPSVSGDAAKAALPAGGPIDAQPAPADHIVEDAMVKTVAPDVPAPIAKTLIEIKIATDPTGADIIIGEKTGKSPMTVDVDASVGTVKVSAKRSGYETIVETIDLRDAPIARQWKLKRKSSSQTPRPTGTDPHRVGDELVKPGDL
jgi:eukaryotic-like serine/threonine-protein kinase